MQLITFDSLQTDNGKYKNEQGEFAISQAPYPDVNAGSSVIGGVIMPGEAYWQAAGFDHQGNPFRLVWGVADASAEDASDACDWSNFVAVPVPSGDVAPWHPDYL